MVNEITIMRALKEVIETELNNYTDDSLDNIDTKNVIIDFPNVDLMTKKTCIFIQPNYGEYENLSTNSDDSSFSMNIFILCKRDKHESLVEKVFGFYNALYKLIRTNITLNETVDFVDIESFDYYPQVEANSGVVGIEALITCRYTKDY